MWWYTKICVYCYFVDKFSTTTNLSIPVLAITKREEDFFFRAVRTFMYGPVWFLPNGPTIKVNRKGWTFFHSFVINFGEPFHTKAR